MCPSTRGGSIGGTPSGRRRRSNNGQPFLGSSEKGVVRSLLGSLGRPEHPLADDVALHLVGAAVDRRRLGEQRHLGDARRRTGRPSPASSASRVVAVVGVQHAAGPEDAQAEVAGQPHDLAHRQLGDVAACPGCRRPLPSQRLHAQAV